MPVKSQEFENPPSLFDPSPYGFSHTVTIPQGYSLVFIAGQGGEEDTEGKLSANFRRQVAFSLKNIKDALAFDSLSMDNVVKLTTLVVDHPRLAIEGMLIEIDAIAVRKTE